MERSLTHRQLQELLGAFALDAVDPEEAAAVEAHLAECPRCREEVAAHRETAAFLASAGSPAPSGVWDRIAAELGHAGLAAGEAPDGSAANDSAADEADRAAARIADLVRARGGPDAGPLGASPGRRRRRLGRVPSSRTVAAALAVAAVLVAVLGVQLARLDRRLDDAKVAQSVDEAALVALSHPDARRVQLTSDDGSQSAEAVLLPDGQGFLFPRTLRPLTEAETYQLWAVVGDQKISVGVLGAAPKVTAFHYDAEPSVFAITAERAGGVVASGSQAVVVGVVEPRSA